MGVDVDADKGTAGSTECSTGTSGGEGFFRKSGIRDVGVTDHTSSPGRAFQLLQLAKNLPIGEA